MGESSPSSSEPKALPQLDYAAAPPRWQRWRRRMLFGLAMAALASVAVYWGPGFYRRAQVLYSQHQCLNYTAPADQVVYEEEPKRAGKLLAQSSPYTRRRSTGVSTFAREGQVIYTPACWPDLLARISWRPARIGSTLTPGAVVFLHELQSPNGTHYLAEVEYFRDDFVPQWIPGFNCFTNTITPGTLFHDTSYMPKGYSLSVAFGGVPVQPNTRVYAGQIDPADPSHFTIRYEMWGQSDVVDGHINNSGGITLKQRNQPRPPDPADGNR